MKPKCVGIDMINGIQCKARSTNSDTLRCDMHSREMMIRGRDRVLYDELNFIHETHVRSLFNDNNVVDIEREYERLVNELEYSIRELDINVDVFVENKPLQSIALDKEGVHRLEVLDHIKNNLKVINKIPVPKEYKWNTQICSRTPSDIIEKCSIPPNAVGQMIRLYCSDEDVYSMGQGIYGQTLDKVWQYILKSKHKDELIKILKSTLLENVATCAAGNLTRLLTVLVGYIDDLTQGETMNETLGREIGQIATDKHGNKYHRVVAILDKYKIPKSQRTIWLQDFENGFF